MVTRNRLMKDMTKAELVDLIRSKTTKIPARFQPQVKTAFLSGLRYKTKPQLKRIASRMKVEWDAHGGETRTPEAQGHRVPSSACMPIPARRQF